MLTCARGSSDHAATYARYLIETSLGLVTSSASPSVSSVYGVRQDLDPCLFLVISQSGRSPDLLAAAAAAKASGALVVALVNDEDRHWRRRPIMSFRSRAGRGNQCRRHQILYMRPGRHCASGGALERR